MSSRGGPRPNQVSPTNILLVGKKKFSSSLLYDTRPLWIIASVQHPSLTVAPLHVTFDHLYLGFDCTAEFTVKNPALFRVTFSWGHLKDCQHIRIEHCTPVLIDKLEEKTVSIKFTAIALVNQS